MKRTPVSIEEPNTLANIHFSDNAEEELAALTNELKLARIVPYLDKDASIPEHLKGALKDLAMVIVDLFSPSLPSLYSTPEETLRVVSRDINLSRFLRERGIIRLYMLTNSRVEIDEGTIRVFQSVNNPNTESPFRTQEEFLAWFCKEASVSRALIFLRFAAYDRLTKYFDYTLEDAFKVLTSKPSVISETIRSLASWTKEADTAYMDPDVAITLVNRLGDESLNSKDKIKEVATALKDETISAEEKVELTSELSELIKPYFKEVVEEVMAHDNARDASDMVKVGILKKPEINYYWNEEFDSLEVEIVRVGVDEETNEEYVSGVDRMLLLPDTRDLLPKEIKSDLVSRLPIKNKEVLTRF